MALDLDRLVAGAVVRLPGAGSPVRLISVEPGSFWSFVYEHADGLDRVTAEPVREMTKKGANPNPRLDLRWPSREERGTVKSDNTS